MADKANTNPSLRIDWFDGTVIEEPRNSAAVSTFEDEETPEPPSTTQADYKERKLMGFKRLLELSNLEPSTVTLQLTGRSSFWDLLNAELKDDFIVLITKILAKLYIFLLTNKSIMLTNLLETRFLTSKFLDVLIGYLLELPDTRISEKRMNMQFWDDFESFYNKVLTVCEGIFENSVEFSEKVLDVLEAVRTSISGLVEHHQENDPEDVYLRVDILEDKIKKSAFFRKVMKAQKEAKKVKSADPNNFRNLNIFPTKQDLLEQSLVEIKPNITKGAYCSVDHYLDVQFKLLREDCFGPLREGISKYMENPSKKRHENIRVHPKVRIVNTYLTKSKVGYLVDIAWQERSTQGQVDSKKYAQNKQLMFGSLLLLTPDNFETIYCATVLDSNHSLLNDGYLAISFHSQVSKSIFSEAYLMIESEVFFEPYHRVLKVLQNSTNEIPMGKYIVEVQQETKAPAYLKPETKYSLNKHPEEIYFPVLDTNSWPSNEAFGLDQSQMEAFKLALTREFAVIQGPPGTGKTFIGIKVASTLLQNLSLFGTPMLVICYTNHALDQFLEGILKVTNRILRLGSQSKNPAIEPFTLYNMRRRFGSQNSYLYSSKRTEQEFVYDQMMEIQTEIVKCEKEILAYKKVKAYLKNGDQLLKLKSSSENPVLKWLFGHLEGNLEEHVSNEEQLEESENEFDDVDEKMNINSLATCFSEEWAAKEIEAMCNSIKYVKDVTEDPVKRKEMIDRFQMQIDKVRKRLSYFKKSMCYQSGNGNIRKVSSPYELTPEERWQTYYNAVNEVKNILLEKIKDMQEKHDLIGEEMEELSNLIDYEVARSVKVVGVTTTVAARRHNLLQALRSSIVIIEEAAEVLEAHIVASLTHHCQHVILIGDHKQLRPTAAHYILAKEYNLEISLFERMINNGIHARTLTTQRRMRPEFVDLIVPAIYKSLECHPVVYEYGDVKGMADNLFFFTHFAVEDESIEDSWSQRSRFEAKWCVSLGNYLCEKEYNPEDITILATYNGQANLIKEMAKKYSKMRDVKVTVVDNYQGEESRIVILSLVRSNREGKIGFLSAQNRICVALSRAKEGLYIFGNMSMLKSSSHIWRSINDALEKRRAIGTRLKLRCDNHPQNTLQIERAEEMDACLLGKCLKVCLNK